MAMDGQSTTKLRE